MTMVVVDVKNREQIQIMLRYFRMMESMAAREWPLHSIRVGIDPADNGVRFSVDYSTWSMPMTGEMEK